MCGIVGIVGNLDYKDEKLTKALLMNDYVRGPDSTGFASVTKTGDARIAKVSSNPFSLFEMKRFNEALKYHDSLAFLGHNRAATRGRIVDGNAHPFVSGDIVGVHNGTLDVQAWRELEDALGDKYGTDSEAIVAGIDTLGIKDTMSICSGAWSLVWVNLKSKTLNLLRNKDRPMYLAYSKEFNKLYLSSAWEILSASIMVTDGYSASDLDHSAGKDKIHTYWPTDVDTHYTYDLEELYEAKKKIKPRVKTIKGREAAPVTPYHNPFITEETGTGQNVIGLPPPVNPKTSGKTQNSTGSDKVHETITNLFHNQPFAELISKAKFDEISRHGCSWCGGNDFEFFDQGWVVIERDDTVICPDCTKDRGGNRIYTKQEMYLD